VLWAMGAAAAMAAPTEAGIFGVPTDLAADGRVCLGNNNPSGSGCTTASIDPPGWFLLSGTASSNSDGDTVHQLRLFVEVTGSTLDIKVFDPGNSGARDLVRGADSETTYQLRNPSGTLVRQIANFDNDSTSTTQNRLARFSSTGTSFTAANAGSIFTGDDDINAFGVDIRDGAGNHYNVYTYGQTANPDTAMLVGSLDGNSSPDASITQPMVFYPYVNRGCSVNTSNYDMDATSSAGAGASATLVDAGGAATILTMSGGTSRAEDTVTIENQLGNNPESLNYGIYTLTNDTGSQDNRAIDWRVADFQGWNPTAANLPADPVSAIRTYLPNGYAPVTGSPNAVAPLEPVAGGSTRIAGGANPPTTGQSTTFLITGSVFNPTGAALSNVQITIPIVPGAAYVAGSQQGCVDGVGPVGSGCEVESAAAPACVDGSGSGFRRCTFATLPAGSVASLNVQVTLTPAGTGYFGVTGTPSGGSPPPDSTLWAQYTPAFSSAAFPQTEVLGPVCELVAYAPPRTDLRVATVDSPDPVAAGEDLTYTMTVFNDGPEAAQTVRLTGAVPAGTGFQSVAGPAGWTCTTPPVGSSGSVTCIAGSGLPAGSSATFTLVARVDAAAVPGSTITHTASATSAGNEVDPANNSASATTTVAARADLAVAKSDSPDPVVAGEDLTYRIVVTNNGPSAAASATLVDPVPANTAFQAVGVPPGWSCTTPAVGGTGNLSCASADFPAGATAMFTLVVRVSSSTPGGTVIGNTATVGSATPDVVAGNNTASASTTVGSAAAAPACATPGLDGPGGVLAGVVNTYYPGTASAALGALSVSVGTPTGAARPIAAGDLLMVVQMQDAAINSSNTGAYGDGAAGDPARGSTALNNAGIYEFVRATGPVASGSVPIQGTGAGGGLLNAYTHANATGTQGQRRFQVVRVPQYTTATLGPTLTAGRWNGTTGGVLAFDVAGNLALGGTTVNVTGRGFRGGAGRGLTGGTGTGTDYRNPAANNVHGSKAEGIAGTPRYLYDEATGTVSDTGIDGYPNGSSARGAPGNAGGGGTDSGPDINDENSGGGGGGNGGTGGQGGNAWNSAAAVGGHGGAPRPGPSTDASRLFLGGGGGAGTRNNSSGVMSSGGAGGGIVLVRAGTVSGTGTITADGSTGITPDNDGGGGGGAGGTVVVLSLGGGLGGLTVNARGGRGSDAWPNQAANGTPGERHGPGGGGGGGVVLLSSAGAAMSVAGGANGITTTANDPFGATPGTLGTTSTTLSALQIPGLDSGARCSANVSITKTDSPDPALIGQNVTYTIVATNLGFRPATGVTVVDTLPAGVAFVTASSTQGTCVFAAGTITCGVGTLNAGASATVTVVVTPSGVGTVVNSASASAAQLDPDTADNVATATTTVSAAADLGVTLHDSPDPIVPAQLLGYTAEVTNHGPSAAAAATLSFPVPANTTFQAVNAPAGWSCSTPPVGGTGAVVCSTASLPAGESVVFTIDVRVNASAPGGGVLSATATVSTATADPVPANDSATAATPVSVTEALLTRATLRGLRVDPAGLVEFATGSQQGTRAFNLYGTSDPRGRGERVRLNADPIVAAVADSTVPVLYEVHTAPVTAPYLIVEEIDQDGSNFLGPFRVGDPRLHRAYERVERRLAAAGLQETASRGEGRARTLRRTARRPEARAHGRAQARSRIDGATAAQSLRSADGVKILVSRPGIVRLTRDELRSWGLPARLASTTLSVTNQGRPVPFAVSHPGSPSESLEFRVEPLSTTYAAQNAYVVSWKGSGPSMKTALTREGDPLEPGFTRIEQTRIYAPNAPQGSDPWLWDLLWGDGSAWPYAWDPDAGRFDLPGLAAGSGDVAVRVRLVGRTAHRHSVDASINGVFVGRVEFEGAVPALLEGRIPASALLPAGNTLGLTYYADAEPDEVGLAYLDHAELGVPVAPPDEPVAPDAVVAFDESLPSIGGVEYLVVTHPLFAAQAQRIADLKTRDGLRAGVVDVERAYDRFSAGIVEANSIRALVQHAHAAGQGRLRYVLLVGDDTFDYRDVSGMAPDGFLPSLFGWDGQFGRIPAENRTADLDGDGRPEVAIGRLPVQTGEEAEVLVDKIARQDVVVRGNGGRHLFAVDNQAEGEPSFRDEARVVAAQLPRGASTAWADVAEGVDAARDTLAAALSQGAAFTHYFGHGGPEQWADESLLGVDDVANLTGPETVVLTWACESQWFQYLFGRTVNEALVLQPNGGALASFGPAGIADAYLHGVLYERLYRELKDRKVTLGEAIRRAKAAAIAEDPRAQPVVEGWNLLGDPALRPYGMAPVR